MDNELIAALQIPLYKLHYVENIEDEPLTDVELEQFHKDYEPREINRVVKALKWASTHADYPFSSLVPGIGFSNQDVHTYLVNLLRQIERANS